LDKMRQTSQAGALFAGQPAQSFQFERILYTKVGYTATITINRPQVLNCFDFTTLEEMGSAFLDASRDDSVAVVVVTGAGERAFCTGADLKEQRESISGSGKPSDYHKWMYAFIEMHDRLRNIGKPTIARLNGQVVGGGNELNIACDLAIAADHVTIKQVGAARGSVAAGGATQWLPLVIGDRRARQMLFLCEDIDARTALEWGLVNQVVPMRELDAAVESVCQKLYHKLPECTRYTKQQLNFWRDFSWSLTIGHARDWLTLHAGSEEVAHGLNAFSEKKEMDYETIREGSKDKIAGYPPEVLTANCKSCAKSMPSAFSFCGNCGYKMKE
jgi:enoyl-CoA hydratase/carnithine racemase